MRTSRATTEIPRKPLLHGKTPSVFVAGICLLIGCSCNSFDNKRFTWPGMEDGLPVPQDLLDQRHPSLIPAIDEPPAAINTLNAREAVRLALQHSRDLRTLNDALVEQTYETLAARRNFAWDADIVGSWETDDEGDSTSDIQLDIRETLGTGGDILFRTNLDADDGEGGVTFRIAQPVLAGAGHTISHEAAIQSHRSLLYELRRFETEREDTLIGVLDAYYDLINQESVLENVRRNLEQSRFLAERSEAVFKVQKATYLDVLRAKQQLLTAENQLANSEADVVTARKSFLALLGLDTELAFDIVSDPPPLLRLRASEPEIMRAGFANRRGLKTAANRIEDAERRLKLSRNNLLPDLELFARTDAFSEETELREDNFTTGASISIPLQRGGLRDNVRLAEIAMTAARRNQINTEANVRIELLRRINQLANFERNVETQRQNVEIAEKRLEFAIIRFEDGTLSNRDVVEAQRALVNHELERLRLLQSAGCLVIDPNGRLLARDLDGGRWFEEKAETPIPAARPIPSAATAEPPSFEAESEVGVGSTGAISSGAISTGTIATGTIATGTIATGTINKITSPAPAARPTGSARPRPRPLPSSVPSSSLPSLPSLPSQPAIVPIEQPGGRP